jgi:hypothetical protein
MSQFQPNMMQPVRVPLRQLILADPTFHLPSRLAWLMTDASGTSGESYMRWATMTEATGASDDELERALRTITETWKLFRWDKDKGAFLPVRNRGETSRVFKARVQKQVNLKLGIAWVLRDLLEGVDYYPCVPHSVKQFADQLDCEEKSVSRVMRGVLSSGYFLHYRRCRGSAIFARFDCHLRNALDAKYTINPRTVDADGVNPNVEPSQRRNLELVDSRGNKSRSTEVTNLGTRGNKSRSRGNKSWPWKPKIVINNNELRPPIQLDKQLVSFGNESSSST